MKRKDIGAANRGVRNAYPQLRELPFCFYLNSDDSKKRVWLDILHSDNNGAVLANCTFPVDWLPPEQAPWLAGVLYTGLKTAYEYGVKDEHKRALERGQALKQALEQAILAGGKV